MRDWDLGLVMLPSHKGTVQCKFLWHVRMMYACVNHVCACTLFFYDPLSTCKYVMLCVQIGVNHAGCCNKHCPKDHPIE